MNADAARRYLPHGVIAAVALLAIAFPGETGARVQGLAGAFLRHFDWLTLLVASGAVLVCAVVVLLPIGRHRIGGTTATPEFRLVTWLSMLFAAGMGAGLVFWGAAEPLIHFLNPPPGGPAPASDDARRLALALTQFHWSLHAWAVYAVAALAIAAFAGRGHAPLPSSPLVPASGKLRRTVDWIALIAVLVGVVASVSAGALQMGAGVARVSGGSLPNSPLSQSVLLVLLTAAYLTSVVAGLRRGIAFLSNVNMGLALVLALYFLFAGPTAQILTALGESASAYLSELLSLSTQLRAEGEARQWTRDWSLTTLLWWIAWTPFIGTFIARISYGRRLRTLVLGVLLVPTLVTLIWFSLLGGTALHLAAEGVDLGVSDFATAPAATYAVLEHLPLTKLTQSLTLLLVFTFLLTSADSGAYVLGMFSRGTMEDPPLAERLFWGLVIAVLSGAAILSAGGQSVVRAFAVSGAIPMVLLLAVQAGALLYRWTWWVQSHTTTRSATESP
ncbi:MAG: BCCT family transporter [Pseudomonadota bacterium]